MTRPSPSTSAAEARETAESGGSSPPPAAAHPEPGEPRAPGRGFLRRLPVLLALLGLVWLGLDALIFHEGRRHLRDLERVSTIHRDYRDFTTAADRIKTGSDNLTKAVRRYAATGAPRFMEAYEREEKIDCNREHALEIIDRKLPPDDPARVALHESMEHSIALQDTEHHAMRLVAEATGLPREEMPDHVKQVTLTENELAMSPAQMRQRATDLLYNTDYFAAKSNILDRANSFLDSTIGQTVDNFDETSQETIRSVTRQMILFTLALAVVFAILIASASIGYALFSRMTRENLRLVDDLRRERDATIAAQKAKSMFFSMVSHDIRTPLNSIVGFSEMLRDGIEDPAERRENIENILFSAHTLLSLVNDVLDLSKLDANKMKFSYAPCDLPSLLRRVIGTFRLQAAPKELELRIACGPVPRLVLDEERIRQVLVNLVSNAVKFTDKGFVEIQGEYTDGTLRLAVRDTGRGIAPEDKPRVLEPFVQVGSGPPVGGTGLGLPICKSLVEHMGGSFSLESELGRGSVFTIVLPGVATAPEEPSPAPAECAPAGELPGAGGAASPDAAAPEPVAGGARTAPPDAPPPPALRSALIVDDVPINLKVEQALLHRAGIAEIVTADSGADALAVLDQHGPFDIVFTDLWMPEMDGYELCNRLREDDRWRALRVYAVTADVEARRTAVSRGFDGILLKPITKAVLAEFLSSLPPA